MTNPIPPDLEVHGMTKRFGPLVTLKDVNFRLRPGQFHALLGENARAKGPSRRLGMSLIRKLTGISTIS